jgi:tetratricopeptide (TPR) repeat protein
MRYFKELKAAFLFGKAIKCFLNKNYSNAISLFVKILEITPNDKDIRFTNYYLGRSYFATGKNAEARGQMSDAYNLFLEKIKADNNEKDFKYFRTLSREYIQLLNILGDHNLMEDVSIERKRIMKRFQRT